MAECVLERMTEDPIVPADDKKFAISIFDQIDKRELTTSQLNLIQYKCKRFKKGY